MTEPRRMRSDPELGKLLRSDLDASASHSAGYDVEKGVTRHLALIAGVGAAAATATATATATASTSSVATAASVTTATAAATTTTVATGGLATALGVKTMAIIAAIGVVAATGGVIAVKRGSSDPPKPAAVTVTQPRSGSDQVALPPRATVEGTLETAPTVTPDDLPLSMDGVQPTMPAPTVSGSKIETDNYARARALAATDPSGALAIVEADNKKFPRGVFAEEREALAIDCLVRTSRMAEAQERGRAFLAAHPTSPFAEKIRAQIDSH